LAKANREDALAALFQHTGWKFLRNDMKEKVKSLERKYRTVDPSDSVEIARIQSQINILEKYIDKPENYFRQRKRKYEEDN